MAPVQQIGDIPDIPAIPVEAQDAAQNIPADASPSLTFNYLTTRSDSSSAATTQIQYGQGTIDPSNIKMQGLMALFAIIGAAFVLAGIWFFFWAKNGGFVWRKGDWEDYKSTVLRRKGPDGYPG